ncbi:MAG: hypothetical protein JSS49_05825 [Planctomycetes bacterium]|nr:hypothetical protein [Planctomycetota bacterium]
MSINLAFAVLIVGVGQLSVLVASSLVPVRLKWNSILAPLPPLVRQLFWVYGGYVVLSIIALGTISVVCADELASGSLLARAFCAYGMLFWGIRLSLQPFLCAKPYLTTWWLFAGYHLLTVLFTGFTLVFAWCVVH